MEKEPYIDEEEPLPRQFSPELELAWRGLLISMKHGGLPRTEAIKLLETWDTRASSSEEEHPPLKRNVEVS